MEVDVHTIENFYGVYLLFCLNPKYYGRTYIGYTVDPNRRIKQHNKGKDAGGAWKTSNRGPWEMVLIIHGFPNDIAALRFEWAWQHPQSSRRLNHISKKSAKEKVYDYCIRILSEMLHCGPWNRLPLTIRWISQEHIREFKLVPPMHMPIVYGPVTAKKIATSKKQESQDTNVDENIRICSICFQNISGRNLSCLSPNCDLVSHVVCLSKHFIEKGEYIPIQGSCPNCKEVFLWGDIIRKSKGCYSDVT